MQLDLDFVKAEHFTFLKFCKCLQSFHGESYEGLGVSASEEDMAAECGLGDAVHSFTLQHGIDQMCSKLQQCAATEGLGLLLATRPPACRDAKAVAALQSLEIATKITKQLTYLVSFN